MGKRVETGEDRIQNLILTATDFIDTPRIELAVRSRNASSERNVASVIGNLEQGEGTRIAASFENVPERKHTLHELNANDETRTNIPDMVSELSVPGAHFDRKSHTHQSCFKGIGCFYIVSDVLLCPDLVDEFVG